MERGPPRKGLHLLQQVKALGTAREVTQLNGRILCVMMPLITANCQRSSMKIVNCAVYLWDVGRWAPAFSCGRFGLSSSLHRGAHHMPIDRSKPRLLLGCLYLTVLVTGVALFKDAPPLVLECLAFSVAGQTYGLHRSSHQ